MASADLNRDGHIDLVFANAETSKTHDPPSHIYWGSEQGFHPARRSHLQGFGAVGVAAADLNRDGHPDIVLMNRLSGRKAGEIPSLIFWGNSAHHYSEANAALIPAPAKPYFSKIADFDDDGYPDLVFSGVSPFLLWGGPRGFVRTFRFGLDARTTGIDVADYDRDGYLDVIFLVMSRDPSVRHYGLIYLGGADGFSGARTLRVALRAYKSLYLATADLDRDGFLDLIFGGTETPDQPLGDRLGGPERVLPETLDPAQDQLGQCPGGRGPGPERLARHRLSRPHGRSDPVDPHPKPDHVGRRRRLFREEPDRARGFQCIGHSGVRPEPGRIARPRSLRGRN